MGKMARPAGKELVTMPDNPNFISGTHVVEEVN